MGSTLGWAGTMHVYRRRINARQVFKIMVLYGELLYPAATNIGQSEKLE
jgi:hypothetical protein